MKTKKINFTHMLVLMAIMGLAIFSTSCEEKAHMNTELNELEFSQDMGDELYTAAVFDEVLEIGDEATYLYDGSVSALKSAVVDSSDRHGNGHMVHGGPHNYRLSECVTVTKIITDSTKTTIIDFGEANCLGNDGRERRGKIIMLHTGSYWEGSATISFTFEDFFVDDNQVTGEKNIVQMINADGNRERTMVISGAVTFADGSGSISYQAEKVRVIVEGSDTRYKGDDVIETTGMSHLTRADGSEKIMTILSPLVRKNDLECRGYIIQGIRQIEETGVSTKSIDYGDGTCDNIALLTQDGITTEIELSQHRHRRH